MKAIAFYLPQYHVIPENEAIYGRNFTEWDNVRRAKSLFAGHPQPVTPHQTIGYYNLLDEKFLTFQHALAYENGVEGFCYYYYNFAGKRLLEKPLDLINASTSIRNSFCLCWAHGSWYNNHDNRKEITVPQIYTSQNARQLFRDLAQYFDNERYIRINGKPLLAIFAPEQNPMMGVYADILREMALKYGLPGIWLAGVAAFADLPPRLLGLDSMIEFAPNWNRQALVSEPGASLRKYDYARSLYLMAAKEPPDYIYNRCVYPGWDNTPRRGPAGIVFTNNHPELYKMYLEGMAAYTREFLPTELQYIFINAWNEWGEGCHLEPDAAKGFSLLKATRDVMGKFNAGP